MDSPGAAAALDQPSCRIRGRNERDVRAWNVAIAAQLGDSDRILHPRHHLWSVAEEPPMPGDLRKKLRPVFKTATAYDAGRVRGSGKSVERRQHLPFAHAVGQARSETDMDPRQRNGVLIAEIICDQRHVAGTACGGA